MKRVIIMRKEWQRRIEDFCAGISGLMIFLMMSLTSIDILLRYFFNSPIPSTYELMELCLPVAAYLPFAYVQRIKGHITIEFLTERLSPKTVSRLNILVYAGTLGICLIITWRTAVEAVISFRGGEFVFGLVQYPLFPSRAFVSFGLGLLCLRLIGDLYRQITGTPHREETSETKDLLHGT
jgi:TRAP-type C4-dicarboxylate transport system permease small subunit